MKNVVAGIILYNPDVARLKESLEQLDGVGVVFLVDNGSKNIIEIKELICEGVVLVENGKNLGVARALNIMMEKANEIGAEFLLTLDQDSVLSRQALIKMLSACSEGVAIVCPRIVDVNKDAGKKFTCETEDLERCITSGSLMNLQICNKVGKFDERMFIDWVDHDYCKRVRISGYRILRINGAEMKHEVGKRTKRRFLWMRVYPTNHSAERVYYYVRNIYYYVWKFRGKLSFKERAHERITLLWKYISILLYEKDKRSKLKAYMTGRKDGKTGILRTEET